jgi:hypothetical protein
MYALSYMLIIFVILAETTLTLTSTTPKPTKSSLSSLIVPATTLQTPLLEINPKVEAKDVFANLENSIKSVSNMFNSNNKDSRHIIKDIPRLFACLEDDSKMDDCCKIDHFR